MQGIRAVGAIGETAAVGGVGAARRPAGNAGFAEQLKLALDQVQATQAEADQVAVRLAAGEPVELHEAMLATEKATLALQLTLQVRNRVVEAYQEIMRMQV